MPVHRKMAGWYLGWLLLFTCGCSDYGAYRLLLIVPEDAQEVISEVAVWALEPGGRECAQLIDGSQDPSEMTDHSQLVAPYPPQSSVRLKRVPAGQVMFFAEGRTVQGNPDSVVLRGCSLADVVSGQTIEVRIELQWVCVPDPAGEILDNQKDDDCDGLTDECDNDAQCQADDLWCNGEERCQDSACVHQDRDCSGLENQCNASACDEDQDACIADPLEDGTPCDDGLYCTGTDGCDQGVCAGIARDCADAEDCTTDGCDEFLDECTHRWVENPGAEGLGLPGTCDDSLDNDCDHLTDLADPDCQPCQSDQDCDDGNVCTLNTCNTQQVCESASNDGVSCDDEQNCTVSDQCSGGVCTGQPVDCSGLDSDCTLGVCNPTDGTCVIQTINQGQACTDDLYCQVDTTCDTGQCTGGSPRDCSAQSDPCNLGVCNEQLEQCQADPLVAGTGCDDELYCTGSDTCDGAGACIHTGDPCQAGAECQASCNDQAGNCIALAGEPCGDPADNLCNQADSCDGAGTCQSHIAPGGAACDDGLFCNGADTCDGAGDCLHTGNPCGPGEMCREGTLSCELTPVRLTQIATGQYHTCGLTAGGQAWCWGYDLHGELGNGGTSSHAQLPQAVDTSSMTGETAFAQIGPGGSHTCGLTAEGMVWCWGDDQNGQLGDGGIATQAQSPVPLDTTSMTGQTAFAQISVGGTHVCGITAEGKAWCWGHDLYGQLGDGGVSTDAQSPVAVDTTSMTGAKAFIRITAGHWHTCGLTAERKAWCWGQDTAGQLGNGVSNFDTQSPGQVDTSDMSGETAFVGLAGGLYHTCGLTAEGVAWCWGGDANGQLGNGEANGQSQVPSAVDTAPLTGEEPFVQLAATSTHTCGITAAGKAWCWGADGFGQLGDGGGSEEAQSPVEVDISGVTGEKAFVEIGAGLKHTCARTAAGQTWCWGYDDFGQLGEGAAANNTQVPVAVDVSFLTGVTGFVHLAGGGAHTCSISSAGTGWCWGRDEYGELGNGGTSQDVQIPTAVNTASMTGEKSFVRFTAGAYHTSGLTAQGVTWSFGRDTYGQLGSGGGPGDSQNPVILDPTPLGATQTMSWLSAWVSHTCGLTSNGMAFCWGRDLNGQLGDGGGSTDAQSPVAVDTDPLTDEKIFLQIESGAEHSCGLTSRGVAWCWGSDDSGQLGDGGSSTATQSPVAVDTTLITGERHFAQLAVANYHTCGLTAQGLIWCWGANENGQLGNGGVGTTSQHPVAVETSSMTGQTAFTQLVSGGNHTCALTAVGVAWCWGWNLFGQLGVGEGVSESLVPMAVDTTSMAGDQAFVVLMAGSNHTCGLTATGAAWCWGWDSNGQLGDGGTSQTALSPVMVNTSPL